MTSLDFSISLFKKLMEGTKILDQFQKTILRNLKTLSPQFKLKIFIFEQILIAFKHCAKFSDTAF